MEKRHKKARELSRFDRIEMGKRDNYKDYIEIVNEAGIGQKLLFKTSNIEAQNLMVHFEGGGDPSGVSLMSFQNFFAF